MAHEQTNETKNNLKGIKLCWHEYCSGKPTWTYLQTEASTYLTLSQETEAVHTGGFVNIENSHLQILLPDSFPWQQTYVFSNQVRKFCLCENCCWASAGRETLRALLTLHTVFWGPVQVLEGSVPLELLYQCPWKLCLDWQAERGFWQTDSLCEKKATNFVLTLFEHLPRAA